jgi:hypothetical protein
MIRRTQTTADRALPKTAGGSMAGNITLGTYNIVGTGLIQGYNIHALKSAIDGAQSIASTAQYTANAAFPITGGIIGGNINMGNFNINGEGFIQGYKISILNTNIASLAARLMS